MAAISDAYAVRSAARQQMQRAGAMSRPKPAHTPPLFGAGDDDVSLGDRGTLGVFIAVAVSYLVVVGVNAAVWLLLLEILSFALSFDLSNTMRVNVALGLIGVPSLTWAGLRQFFGRQMTL